MKKTSLTRGFFFTFHN